MAVRNIGRDNRSGEEQNRIPPWRVSPGAGEERKDSAIAAGTHRRSIG